MWASQNRAAVWVCGGEEGSVMSPGSFGDRSAQWQ